MAGHNSIVSLDGARLYVGGWSSGADYKYLHQIDPATNTIIKKIGPLRSGVRPFSINGAGTLAFTTASDFLGFEVSDITSGQLLHTMPVAGFPTTGCITNAPSHGISLSPDETEVYVVDCPNSYVHVFDVTGLPGAAPQQVADIPLSPIDGYVSGCASRCGREGWLLHSADGRFVYVGDSGDVIDTATRSIVTNIDTLGDTRKVIEIDWRDGAPFFTTSRSGLGYKTPFLSGLDADRDGCADFRERGPDWRAGGQRDPDNDWDIYDVPAPALRQSMTTGAPNRAVTLADVQATLTYIGTAATIPNKQNVNGVAYGSDWNANGVQDGAEYDRTPSTTPGQPWKSGPPSGGITLSDVQVALAQVGTTCR